VPAQVLEEILALTRFGDRKQLVHRRGGDSVALRTEVFRMTVGEVGIVTFDANRFESQYVFRERLCATEPGMQIVDLLDGKHHW
jgi:hypothetical protein